MEHRYRREALDQLAVHGVRSTLVTPPDLVHEFLNNLCRYELRRLRDRLLRREIAKSDFFDRLVEVWRRHPLFSLKAWQWVEG